MQCLKTITDFLNCEYLNNKHKTLMSYKTIAFSYLRLDDNYVCFAINSGHLKKF